MTLPLLAPRRLVTLWGGLSGSALLLLSPGCSTSSSPVEGTVVAAQGGAWGQGGSGGAAGSVPSAGGGAGRSGGSGTLGTGGGGAATGGSPAWEAGGSSGGGAGGSAGNLADPVWVALPGQVAGCPIERLQLAAPRPLFVWQPCQGIEGCEESSAFDPALLPDDYTNFSPSSSVLDDGVSVHIGLFLGSSGPIPPDHALFLNEDGLVFDGYRVAVPGPACGVRSAAVGPNSYGVRVSQLNGDTTLATGGILVSYSDGQPHFFDVPVQPGYGPQSDPMGDTRWVWAWSLVDELTSVKVGDGTDFQLFGPTAPTQGPVLGLQSPVSTGPAFLFEQYLAQPSGELKVQIGLSDGVSAPIPYVAPSDGADYGSPRFEQSHVTWRRGTGAQASNIYSHIEMWSSPFDPDPGKLQPTKVADLPYTTTLSATMGGGWGTLIDLDGPAPKSVVVWDLVQNTHRTVGFPAERDVTAVLGVTRAQGYLRVGLAHANQGQFLTRLKLP